MLESTYKTSSYFSIRVEKYKFYNDLFAAYSNEHLKWPTVLGHVIIEHQSAMRKYEVIYVV